MTYELVFAVVGAAGVAVIALRRLHQAVARDLADADRAIALEELRLIAMRPPMPPPPPIRQAHGTINYETGHRVPTMPRPAPTARCQWCRVKLTNGECVDGCGGHQ